ncbi:PadR family transcriptional regulator [Promicromonospora iranensis]|uniref:DNA-binding PadR family transcriptional regulator n=1 Tax=Promicromonospora iranensis TaxID=1105144 RepID=A0ABU2CSK5_9MICO|nr:PadR family transcriptional regulator [Promicromonospora iranensis]MDR7384323.1 DNA-binding PadR family transcriptional regulator [Promicromonospora iranensis]
MSIRQGFLALLSEQPMHGYQLRQEFERRTGGAWPLNIGQAYTTLARLQRDGLVEPVADGTEGSPEQFRLTGTGAVQAEAWWVTSVGREKPGRDELAIKLALAVTVPGVDVTAVVRRQRDETLRALRALTKQKRGLDPAADLAHSLVLESQVFAAEAEARWLDHVEASVAAYGPARAGTAGSDTTTNQPTGALTKEMTR